MIEPGLYLYYVIKIIITINIFSVFYLINYNNNIKETVTIKYLRSSITVF